MRHIWSTGNITDAQILASPLSQSFAWYPPFILSSLFTRKLRVSDPHPLACSWATRLHAFSGRPLMPWPVTRRKQVCYFQEGAFNSHHEIRRLAFHSCPAFQLPDRGRRGAVPPANMRWTHCMSRRWAWRWSRLLLTLNLALPDG